MLVARTAGPAVGLFAAMGEPVVPLFDPTAARSFNRSPGIGSGVVVDNQGNIVTNFHIVQGANQIIAQFRDGTMVPATIVDTDVRDDLAVVRVSLPSDEVQPQTSASPSLSAQNAPIFAVGDPREWVAVYASR